MASRNAKGPDTQVVQDSPLFDLPPELRNLIYEYVVTDTKSIVFHNGTALHLSALSAVCHQIRREYEGVERTEAPQYAKELNFHITNFLHQDIFPTIKSLEEDNHSSPQALDYQPEQPKTIQLHVHLTNTFERYLMHLRKLAYGLETDRKRNDGQPERLECKYRIYLDHRTFDVQYAKQAVAKMDWCLKRPGNNTAFKFEWPKMEKAFADAFEQCEAASRPAKGGGRKRKGGMTFSPFGTFEPWYGL